MDLRARAMTAVNDACAVLGKSLTDEDTYSYVNDMPLFNGARQGRLDAPRSYAVRGRYRF